MNQDELSTIKNYISVIEKERNAFIFLEPVDYVGMNLPDYPQIIKHPMDLGTIKKKINDNKYRQGCEKLEPSNTAGGNVKMVQLFEKKSGNFSKGETWSYQMA